jgi:hypothetical protein
MSERPKWSDLFGIDPNFDTPAPRQDSLTDQLRDLIRLANRGGMYDAADYLTEVMQRAEGRIGQGEGR